MRARFTVAAVDHLDERVDKPMTRRQQLGRSPSPAADAVGLERDPSPNALPRR